MPRASSRSSSSAACSSAMAGSHLIADLGPQQPQREREHHEPLLGAVVEVALEPPPLGIARLDGARARGAQLLEPRPRLRLQPLVVEREPGGGADLLEHPGIVEQVGAMGDHRDRPPAAHERRDRAARRLAERDRAALRVDEQVALERVGELERRVAERAGQRLLELAHRGRVAQLDHEPCDARARPPLAHPRPCHPERDEREGRRLREPQAVVGGVVGEEAALRRRGRSRRRPARGRRRPAPAPARAAAARRGRSGRSRQAPAQRARAPTRGRGRGPRARPPRPRPARS